MELELLQQILNKLDGLEQGQKSLEHTIIRMENDLNRKMDALRDGYIANRDIIVNYDSRINKLERDVEALDIQIRYLNAGR